MCIIIGRETINVTKSYADKLTGRISSLETSNPDKTFLMTLVSTAPLQPGKHADVFISKVTIEQLFK